MKIALYGNQHYHFLWIKLQDNRINNFIHLLKLASCTCQYFIPSDESLPVLCAKEMTQEAFNCLSASVILLIDECFDVVSKDEYELEKLGRSVFDLLLYILSTPQTSVTLLRTLGGKLFIGLFPTLFVYCPALIILVLFRTSLPTRFCACSR